MFLFLKWINVCNTNFITVHMLFKLFVLIIAIFFYTFRIMFCHKTLFYDFSNTLLLRFQRIIFIIILNIWYGNVPLIVTVVELASLTTLCTFDATDDDWSLNKNRKSKYNFEECD